MIRIWPGDKLSGVAIWERSGHSLSLAIPFFLFFFFKRDTQNMDVRYTGAADKPSLSYSPGSYLWVLSYCYASVGVEDTQKYSRAGQGN